MNTYSNLVRGIQVYISDKINLTNRIMINSGTCRAENSSTDSYKYIPGAYKPKSDWRVLEPDETSILLNSSPDLPFYESIGIVRLPDQMIQLFESLNLHECTNKIDVIKSFLFGRIGAFAGVQDEFIRLLTNLHEPSMPSASARLHEINFSEQNLETVATYYYSPTKELMGLHIDDASGLKNRNKAKNRISLNLGKENRYLLFINKTVTDIHELLLTDGHVSKDDDLSCIELNELFLKYYPDYPVIRIRQDPYDGYIAPTDNLIHDGSTVGTSNPDITVVFTGYFNIALKG